MNFFPHPDEIDKELLSHLEEASTLVCKWIAESRIQGPLPKSISIPEIFPDDEAYSKSKLFRDIETIMKGGYQPSHPGALAHLDPPPLSSSIVGDLICAAMNNNLLAEELSPTLTKLERNLCEWIASKLGLGNDVGGMVISGGSLSNLNALVIARQNSELSYDPNAVVIASEDSHYSIVKAMRIMGLNTDALFLIKTDEEGKMCMKTLLRTFENIKNKGKKCFAVIATAGTTVRGAIDPLIPLVDFCKSQEIWLHVDASIGGAFGLSDSTKELIAGIQGANSITFNPQKLIGVTKTSSLLLISDFNKKSKSYMNNMPYVEPPDDSNFNSAEMGVQGTRSGEVIKLWLALRHLGQSGIDSILHKALSRRIYFEDKIDRQKFDIISGPLHLLAITPKRFSMSESEQWSLKSRNKLLEKNYMLSRPKYKNRFYLKIVLGNPNTKKCHLDELSMLLNNTY